MTSVECIPKRAPISLRTGPTAARVIPADKIWLSNAEAQKYLGMSQSFFKRLRLNGLLPFYKLGGAIFYQKKDIDRLLTKNRII